MPQFCGEYMEFNKLVAKAYAVNYNQNRKKRKKSPTHIRA